MEEKIAQYWQSLLPEKTLFIQEMEQLAKEEHVPIMESAGIETMLQFMRIQKPKKFSKSARRLDIQRFESHKPSAGLKLSRLNVMKAATIKRFNLFVGQV